MAYRLPLVFLGLLLSHTAWAATYKIASLGGLMMQPTSNYFHAVYGASAEVGREDGKLVARMAYLERPQFRSAGFVDQEFFGFFQMGTKLTRAKSHGLWAFVGPGQTTGYVRAEGSKYPTDNVPPTRKHRVPGLNLAMEYAFRWSGFECAATHQILVGHSSNEQLRAYVAWPYHFLLLRMGVAF